MYVLRCYPNAIHVKGTNVHSKFLALWAWG